MHLPMLSGAQNVPAPHSEDHSTTLSAARTTTRSESLLSAKK